jgi:hypothetical protein
MQIRMHLRGVDIRLGRAAKTQHAPRAGQRGEIGGEGIVGIDHGDAVGRQRGVDRALGLGHALDAAQALEMRRRHVVDQRHARTRDGGQISDITRLACAHLEHRVARVLAHVEQAQWQTDFIVLITLRGVRGANAGEDRCAQVLHRGLAAGPGDADHLGRAARTRRAGQIAQRTQRVADLHLRQSRIHAARHQRAGRACSHGLCQIIVAIDALTGQRHEQHARLQCARIRAGATHLRRGTMQAAVRPHRHFIEAHVQHGRASSAARATARSSKGRVVPAIS